jgi:hypothetical protein
MEEKEKNKSYVRRRGSGFVSDNRTTISLKCIVPVFFLQNTLHCNESNSPYN